MEVKDEKLVAAYRRGDEKALLLLMEKYKPMVRKKASELFLVGGDSDDLIQEGMIGLYQAIRDFREEKDSSFSHFAKLVITRRMYSAIEADNRKKNAPLNSYVPIDTEEEGEKDPEELLLQREELEGLLERAGKLLSPMERKVFLYSLCGLTYRETARLLGKEPKSIDNAIQRIRQKLQKLRS